MTKRLLSIVLAAVMLFSLLPLSVSAQEIDAADTAADTVISEANIAGGAKPTAGNTPSYSWSVHTFDEKKFRIKSNAWYNLTDNTQILRTSTFVNTKTYALYLELEALDGYIFDDAANIDTGFLSMITETTHVVYNLDKSYKTIGVYFTFRMSGDTGSCILQFLPNGGFGAKRPVVVTKNKAYTLPSNTFTAPSGGYFKTWSAGEAGSSFNVTKDMDITALWNTVLVDTVGVTGIASPAWTTSPDYTASIVGSGYQLNTAYDDGNYIINGIEWKKYDGTRIPHNLGFSNSDYRFYVTVYLKANTLRWFNDVSKMTATVNGLTATVEKDNRADDSDSGKYIKITYGYQPQLSSMWIKVTAPSAYQKPSYNPNVDNNYSAKLNKNKNTDGFTGGVYWLDLNTRKIMQPDEMFLPGHAYRVVVDIVPANNYEFPVDYQLHTFLPSVKVNDVAVKKSDGGYGDYVNQGVRGEREAWVAYDFPQVTDTTTLLDQAAVTVTEPAVGESPVFSATVPEKGYTVKKVEWFVTSTGTPMTTRMTFEKGVGYTVKVTVAADEGNRFGYSGSAYTSPVYVNGQRGYSEAFTDVHQITACYDFPALEQPVTAISSVAVNGVVTPVAGAHPSYTAFAVDSGKYRVEDDFSYAPYQNGVAWSREDGGDMLPTQVFEAGKKYTVTVSLVPASDSYVFASSALSGKLNGMTAEAGAYNPSTATENIYVRYTFTVAASGGYLVGDADDSGKIAILDATAIQRYLANLSNSSFNEHAADADGDGKVTILDATAIQRYLASFPNIYGIGSQK